MFDKFGLLAEIRVFLEDNILFDKRQTKIKQSCVLQIHSGAKKFSYSKYKFCLSMGPIGQKA